MPDQLQQAMLIHKRGKPINIVFKGDDPAPAEIVNFNYFLRVADRGVSKITLTLSYSEEAITSLRFALKTLLPTFCNLNLEFNFCLQSSNNASLRNVLIPEIFHPQLRVLDLGSSELSSGSFLDTLWLPTMLKFAEGLHTFDLSKVELGRLSTKAQRELRYAISKHLGIRQLFSSECLSLGLSGVQQMFQQEISNRLETELRQLREPSPRPFLPGLELAAASSSSSTVLHEPSPVTPLSSGWLATLADLASTSPRG